MITYKKLGKNGALGNQLWEIAGTYGKAQDANTNCRFPKWFYQPFFSVPRRFFGGWLRGTDLGHDYLQDLSHWSPQYDDDVRAMFKPSARSAEVIEKTYEGDDLRRYTAVHVRRGFNATPEFKAHHPPLEMDYFEPAVDELGGPLCVFSDDIPWCREQSLFKDARFAPGLPPGVDIVDLTKYGPVGSPAAAYDLLAMARCGRHVISNSTFSWWGAWLAQGERVIYPRVWFGVPNMPVDQARMFTGLGWDERG